MPRLFSKLPVSLHSTVAKALVGLAALCALIAIMSFIGFSETTETTGHLWWKENREIPYGERRPYLLAGLGFAVTAAVLLLGALELVAAKSRQRRAQRRWEMSPEGQAASTGGGSGGATAPGSRSRTTRRTRGSGGTTSLGAVDRRQGCTRIPARRPLFLHRTCGGCGLGTAPQRGDHGGLGSGKRQPTAREDNQTTAPLRRHT